jgi:DNA repair protein RecN (Recombination protein N)
VLEEMRIRGLGVIDDAVLELSPGLTVITGETGAGKTMVVTGLGLLFGGRADAGAVRSEGAGALVEGRLRLPADHLALERAREAGAELEDGELLLSRTVSSEGRSRAHLGGRSVPVGVLGELAESCLAVHGQSDQSRLLRPAHQRAALDRFAGAAVLDPLARYTDGYAELRALEQELTELVERARERAQEADLLRFGLDEIAAVAPRAGEDLELAEEEERLGNADVLRLAATNSHDALLGAESGADGADGADASALVAAARATLDAAARHDPALGELAARLREVGYLLADVAADLASYAAGVDTDPGRLSVVQERRAAVLRLTRKYGDDVAEVLAWSERSAARLARLDTDGDRVEELRARRTTLLAELADLATAVSKARRTAAERFAVAVSAELTDLAMPAAGVELHIAHTDDPDGLPVGASTVAFGPHGVDEVDLLLTPHPGAPARSLQKGASGGELSRVMLAVEVVFAGADPVPTLVFDEVDAGVGGKAAVEVGRRLAALARTAQVVVVTHLPQVAAFADRHLVVHKASDGAVTSSGVTALDDAQRRQELSRMLAGIEESQAAAEHAGELLELAAVTKAAGA